MRYETSRRRFLTQAGVAGISAAFATNSLRAIEPVARPGGARLLLSLAAYSMRDYFADATHEQAPGTAGKRINLFEFIDYCAEQGCQGAELTSYYFPAGADSEFLLKLKRHAFLRGVEISGSAVGNTFTHPPGAKRDEQIQYVKRWIDNCQLMGAPHLRVFAGGLEGGSKQEAKARCLEALRTCAEYAGARGIMLGIENHGGIVSEADDLLDLIRAIESPWVGLNLDTGNFHTADPYGDLEKCAPYAVNVQLKVEMQPRGEKRGPADLARIIGMLRKAKYQGYVVLEYEAEKDPWKGVPEALAEIRALGV